MAKNITLSDLSQNSEINKHLIKVEDDVSVACEEALKNHKYAGMKYYSRKTVSSYKSDYDRLDKASDNFNGEWLKLLSLVSKKKKINSLDSIINAYLKYITALAILEESNIAHSALVKANVANLIAEMTSLTVVVIKNSKKAMGKLEQDLRDLIKLIKKAQQNVKEAKLQRILNICLSVAMLALGPVGMVGRIAVFAGGTAAHIAIDAALGPSKGSGLGTLNTATGEVFGVLPQLSASMQNLASGISDIVTYKMDSDEIAEAEEILKEIRKKFQSTIKTYKIAVSIVHNGENKISTIEKATAQAIRTAKSNMKSSKSSAAKRQKFVTTFKQIDLVY